MERWGEQEGVMGKTRGGDGENKRGDGEMGRTRGGDGENKRG